MGKGGVGERPKTGVVFWLGKGLYIIIETLLWLRYLLSNFSERYICIFLNDTQAARESGASLEAERSLSCSNPADKSMQVWIKPVAEKRQSTVIPESINEIILMVTSSKQVEETRLLPKFSTWVDRIHFHQDRLYRKSRSESNQEPPSWMASCDKAGWE